MAILLGRLKLTVEECIEVIVLLAEEVFSLDHMNTHPDKPLFDAGKMEKFAKKIVKKYLGDEDALLCPPDQVNVVQDLRDNTPRGLVYVYPQSHLILSHFRKQVRLCPSSS